MRGRISNPHDAEELISAVFLKVMQKMDSYDPLKASLSTWVYTITRNTVTDHFRTRRIMVEFAENMDGEAISMDELYQTYLDYIPHYYADGMPLSLQLGGFFSASPDKPREYDIPSMKNCSNPDKTCVCGHARMVMYISAEGRALPCMVLSGMDIQDEFPLITEVGLSSCITDSRYMRLIDTRATVVLKHNPECRNCEHAMQCLAAAHPHWRFIPRTSMRQILLPVPSSRVAGWRRSVRPWLPSTAGRKPPWSAIIELIP